MKKNKIQIPVPMKRAYRLLVFELSAVTVAAVAVLISFLDRRVSDRVGAAQSYLLEMEYIGVSLLIAVAAFILADLCEREASRNGKDSK